VADDNRLKISWDDLRDPKVDQELQRQEQIQPWAQPPASTVATSGKVYPSPRSYGTVSQQPTERAAGRTLLSTPLYTCLAGLVGAVVGWVITEAIFGEQQSNSADSIFLHTAIWFGIIGACIGAAIGAVEGVMSRAATKALKSGAIGLAVGLIGCAIGGMIAQFIYSAILAASATVSLGSFMVARTIGWGAAGCFVGLGQGLAILSGRKTLNGFLGGLGGGLLGGFLFDPISLATQSGIVSRLVGLALIGAAAGLLMGLVEQWLKDAWLKVIAGHLTGKEFVIYRNPTMIGSSPKCDIYLFKDATVEPQHTAISNDGRAYSIQDYGTPAGTLVNGRRITNQRLRSGDTIQVGATQFQYSEKTAKRTGG